VFWRALLAFVALPGTVAIAVPWVWVTASGRALACPWALAVLALGLVLLLWCVRDFYVAGKGTLAPWQPPVSLVVVGLYRYSRNPMYVGVTTMLVGWALSFASAGLLLYALAIWLAFELRVIFGEEPWLARTFGDAWSQYVRQVPRWFW
jgi:protein-S-isoprenylcysteine O-methyltransferase Ste14